MKKILLIIIVVVAGGLFIKQSKFFASKTKSSKPLIVTSFYPLYFLAGEIAGDKFDIYNLTPAGAEPHDYELTTGDRARIEDSSLLVLNGLGLEPWGEQIKSVLSGSTTKILSLGDGLDTIKVGETVDSHVWLDPSLMLDEAVEILSVISQIDPVNGEYYQERYNLLVEKLGNLDSKFFNSLSNCKKKEIITSHSAFGYLAKRYGFAQIGIAGLSPDEDPSPKKLAEVADFAKKNEVKYIFFEELVSPKLAETIAREVGAETLVLNPIEGLSKEDVDNGENYFTEMEKNLINLRTALECR